MIMISRFHGILPAIISPCDEKEQFVEEVYISSVHRLYKAGVHGLYVCGATGDGYKLSMEERKRIADISVKLSSEYEGRVIVHVGAASTRDAIVFAEHAQVVGANALASMPPRNVAFSALREYYHDLAAATSLPVLLYYIPKLTGVSLGMEEMLSLLDIPGVVGMKFSDPNLFFLRRLLLVRPETQIFIGHDEFLCPGLLYGACGGIGTWYNLFPDLYVQLYDAVKKKDIASALRLQTLQIQLADIAFRHGLCPVFEMTMQMRGLAEYCFRKPRSILENSLRRKIEPLLTKRLHAIEEELDRRNA